MIIRWLRKEKKRKWKMAIGRWRHYLHTNKHYLPSFARFFLYLLCWISDWGRGSQGLQREVKSHEVYFHRHQVYRIIYIIKSNFCMYKSGLKSSYDDIISAVDDFFGQWDPNTATLTEELCGLQGGILKNKPIWSHSMRVSWSVFFLPQLCLVYNKSTAKIVHHCEIFVGNNLENKVSFVGGLHSPVIIISWRAIT